MLYSVFSLIRQLIQYVLQMEYKSIILETQ